MRWGRSRRASGAVSRNGDPWRERRALVALVLSGNAHQDRLQALKPGGWLEMGTLFAAMQRNAAFGASACEINSFRQRRRAVVAAGGGDMLHQARQAGAGYINRRAGPLSLGTV